jgi:hypothetical protein
MHRILLVLACVCYTVAAVIPGGKSTYDLSSDESKQKMTELIDFGITSLAEQRTKERADSAIADGKKLEALAPLKYEAVSLVGDAQKQIVAGVSYTFKLKIKEAGCADNCPTEICEMQVWEKPWENFRKLTKSACKKRTVSLGGKHKISPNSKEARKALHHVVLKMNKESNDLFYSKPVSVNQAYKQVVNGIKYTLVFNYAKTECKKESSKLLSRAELSECATASGPADSASSVCKVSVVDRPWLESSDSETSRYEVLNHECYQAEN